MNREESTQYIYDNKNYLHKCFQIKLKNTDLSFDDMFSEFILNHIENKNVFHYYDESKMKRTTYLGLVFHRFCISQIQKKQTQKRHYHEGTHGVSLYKPIAEGMQLHSLIAAPEEEDPYHFITEKNAPLLWDILYCELQKTVQKEWAPLKRQAQYALQKRTNLTEEQRKALINRTKKRSKLNIRNLSVTGQIIWETLFLNKNLNPSEKHIDNGLNRLRRRITKMVPDGRASTKQCPHELRVLLNKKREGISILGTKNYHVAWDIYKRNLSYKQMADKYNYTYLSATRNINRIKNIAKGNQNPTRNRISHFLFKLPEEFFDWFTNPLHPQNMEWFNSFNFSEKEKKIAIWIVLAKLPYLKLDVTQNEIDKLFIKIQK